MQRRDDRVYHISANLVFEAPDGYVRPMLKFSSGSSSSGGYFPSPNPSTHQVHLREGAAERPIRQVKLSVLATYHQPRDLCANGQYLLRLTPLGR